MNKNKLTILVGVVIILQGVFCFASADYTAFRRVRPVADVKIDDLYLEHTFVDIEMNRMLDNYREWRKQTGRNDSPCSWMEFVRDVAISQYSIVQGRKETDKLKSALDALIKHIDERQGGIGESKWQSTVPDAEKFLFIEQLIASNRIENENSKLWLYRALSPGFRSWNWEDLAISGDPVIEAKMTDFLDKLQILRLNDFSLDKKIEGIWELKWVYTNKNLPLGIRTRALNMIFDVLDARVQSIDESGFKNSEVLWTNAREVLREIFTAQRWNGIDVEADKDIWQPALQRALQAITRANEFGDSNYVTTPSLTSTDYEYWSWWAITEALSSVNFDDNPELIKELVYSDSSEIIRHVIPSTLAYIQPTKYEGLRDELISYLKNRFLEETSVIWVESLGETIMKIGSPKLVQEMLDIAKGTKQVAGDEDAVFEKRRWAIRTIGETYYSDIGLIYKMRDELFNIALFDSDSKLRNAALASVFKLRRHLEVRNIEFTSPQVEVSALGKRMFDYNIGKIFPTEEAKINLLLGEMEKITAQKFSSCDEVKTYLRSSTPQAYASVIKALVASCGAPAVVAALVKPGTLKENIALIETLTETPFEELVGYMLTRRADNYEPINPNLDAEFVDGVLTVDGVTYTQDLGYPRDIDRPVEIFKATDGSGRMMMLKQGSELGAICEYISQQVYARFIEKKWGSNAGIGVSPLGLVLDPRDGKIKIVSDMIPGGAKYKKGTKFLPSQYMYDERLQSLIGPALILGDGSRTPKGMLFLQRDFEATLENFDNRPDYLLFNVAGLLYSGGMGFKPYGPQFEISGGFDEFKVLTHSSHTGMSGDFTNEAWAELINGEDTALLDGFLSDLQLIKSDLLPIVYSVFNEILGLTGGRYGEIYTVQEWQNEIDEENVFGRWDLGKKRIRGQLLTAVFKNILSEGSLRDYITKSLAVRATEAMQYLGYILGEGR